MKYKELRNKRVVLTRQTEFMIQVVMILNDTLSNAWVGHI